MHIPGLMQIHTTWSVPAANINENVSSHPGKTTSCVERWMNPDQRSTPASHSHVGDRRPVNGAKHLPKLQRALSACVSKHYPESTSSRLGASEVS